MDREMNSGKLFAVVAAFGLAGASFAQVGAFKYAAAPTAAQQNAEAGAIRSITSNYDAAKGELSWKADFTATDGTLPDAFWLVVTGGADPKGTSGQYAAFFMDVTGTVPKLTAYSYNGANGYTSYLDANAGLSGIQAPERIATSIGTDFARSLTVTNANGVRTIGFTADVSRVNAYKPKTSGTAPWEGAKYGANIGVAFHPVANASTSYDADGFLKSFSSCRQGSYDVRAQTAPVPEPATLAVLGAGLAGIARRRRAKRA